MKQCAAVTIQFGEIMEAPHQCPGLAVFPTQSYVTCHGQFPGVAMSPPTIRECDLPFTPHVSKLDVGEGVVNVLPIDTQSDVKKSLKLRIISHWS